VFHRAESCLSANRREARAAPSSRAIRRRRRDAPPRERPERTWRTAHSGAHGYSAADVARAARKSSALDRAVVRTCRGSRPRAKVEAQSTRSRSGECLPWRLIHDLVCIVPPISVADARTHRARSPRGVRAVTRPAWRSSGRPRFLEDPLERYGRPGDLARGGHQANSPVGPRLCPGPPFDASEAS